MDEFAMGSSTEHSAFGPTKNPLDPARVPGGSSGGSAAAVAAHMALGALGTDTGGSIRQPAAHTGLVGMKGSYGSVSRSGLIAMGSSLDQAGPLAKTAEDAEIIFNAIKGQDPMDQTTVPDGLYKRTEASGSSASACRAICSRRASTPTSRCLSMRRSRSSRRPGTSSSSIELPTSKYGLAAYYVVMPAEVSANLARLDGIRYGHAKRGAPCSRIM
jgi:aspartyl-tRNA(Asn)/glutamyl-tRNA(Gln) amidotransferase subunit A